MSPDEQVPLPRLEGGGKGVPHRGAGETFIRNFGAAIGADHEVSEKDEVITPEHSNILYIIMIAEKARMVLHPRCCGNT